MKNYILKTNDFTLEFELKVFDKDVNIPTNSILNNTQFHFLCFFFLFFHYYRGGAHLEVYYFGLYPADDRRYRVGLSG